MRRPITCIAAVLALCAASPAAFSGDAAAGKAKIGTCMACHGNNGKSTAPNYPNLCAQNEKYLVDALTQYKNGARNNPLMKPMVAMLSDADVENVSAYYASQEPCK